MNHKTAVKEDGNGEIVKKERERVSSEHTMQLITADILKLWWQLYKRAGKRHIDTVNSFWFHIL